MIDRGVPEHNMLVFTAYTLDICCMEKLISVIDQRIVNCQPSRFAWCHSYIFNILVLLVFKHLHQPEVFY